MGRHSIKKKKIKICVIGSSRATYGYKNILKILNKDKFFDLKLIVTGMHLSKKHGYSVKDIIADKIPIYKKLIQILKVTMRKSIYFLSQKKWLIYQFYLIKLNQN